MTKTVNLEDKENDTEILVLWLTSTEATKPIFCTMSVFSEDMITARSSVFKIRCIKEFQNARDFISKECDYLMLTAAELNILRNNYNSEIELEIYINE